MNGKSPNKLNLKTIKENQLPKASIIFNKYQYHFEALRQRALSRSIVSEWKKSGFANQILDL
jgi:hypothetical protein